MKRRLTILVLTALAVVALNSFVLALTSPAYAEGATQISGIGSFGDVEGCPLKPMPVSYDFVNFMDGDLDGCLYVFVEAAECSPSGIYRERGTNLFVGYYNGDFGTFEATYHFTAKFEQCDVETGVPGGAEFFGNCHHPIIAGSGTGVFDGVTGRLDFKDNVVDGQVKNFPYRGHLR